MEVLEAEEDVEVPLDVALVKSVLFVVVSIRNEVPPILVPSPASVLNWVSYHRKSVQISNFPRVIAYDRRNSH